MMNYLDFWIEKNRANGKHMHDGKYWTYNSVNAFCELFPYFSRRQISNILNKMVELDLIEKGNFNKSAYDRTCWYAFTEKGKSILQNGEMENTEKGNGFYPEVKPIPVNNNSLRTQLVNTDINIYSYEQLLQCNTDETLQSNHIETLDDGGMKKEKKKTYNSLIDDYTANEELRLALKDYVEMRKSMKGYTIRALEMGLRKLDGLALDDETKIAIVNMAIEHSWKSFYPLSDSSKKKKNRYAGFAF